MLPPESRATGALAAGSLAAWNRYAASHRRYLAVPDRRSDNGPLSLPRSWSS